jgi:hypothetical protein
MKILRLLSQAATNYGNIFITIQLLTGNVGGLSKKVIFGISSQSEFCLLLPWLSLFTISSNLSPLPLTFSLSLSLSLSLWSQCFKTITAGYSWQIKFPFSRSHWTSISASYFSSLQSNLRIKRNLLPCRLSWHLLSLRLPTKSKLPRFSCLWRNFSYVDVSLSQPWLRAVISSGI